MRGKGIFFGCLLGVTGLHCQGGLELLDFNPSVATQLPPTITRVEPTTVAAGAEAALVGFGYSLEVGDNLVILGDRHLPATAYALIDPATADEIERITFSVPADLPPGTYPVTLFVYEHLSSDAVSLTVTP